MVGQLLWTSQFECISKRYYWSVRNWNIRIHGNPRHSPGHKLNLSSYKETVQFQHCPILNTHPSLPFGHPPYPDRAIFKHYENDSDLVARTREYQTRFKWLLEYCIFYLFFFCFCFRFRKESNVWMGADRWLTQIVSHFGVIWVDYTSILFFFAFWLYAFGVLEAGASNCLFLGPWCPFDDVIMDNNSWPLFKHLS